MIFGVQERAREYFEMEILRRIVFDMTDSLNNLNSYLELNFVFVQFKILIDMINMAMGEVIIVSVK